MWTEKIRKAFANMIDLDITIEQQGSNLNLLECALAAARGPMPLSLPEYASQPMQGSSPPQ